MSDAQKFSCAHSSSTRQEAGVAHRCVTKHADSQILTIQTVLVMYFDVEAQLAVRRTPAIIVQVDMLVIIIAAGGGGG